MGIVHPKMIQTCHVNMLIHRGMMGCTQVLSKPKWAEMVLTDFGEDRLLASALKDMTCFLLRNPLPGSVLHSKVCGSGIIFSWYSFVLWTNGTVS